MTTCTMKLQKADLLPSPHEPFVSVFCRETMAWAGYIRLICLSAILVSFILGSTTVIAQTISLTSATPSYTLLGNEEVSAITVANNVNGSIAGAGYTLTYTDSSAGFSLGGTASASSQTLDMSNLTNFVFDNANQSFFVGGAFSTPGSSSGALTLASSNNHLVASSFNVASISNASGNVSSNNGIVLLGQNNHIFADTVNVATAAKTVGDLRFNSGVIDGVLVLRATDGIGRVSYWNIGTNSASGYAGTSGTVDLSGGVIDAKVENLTIGSAIGGLHSGTGELTTGGGVLDAVSITLGQRIGVSGSGTGSGTLTINNTTVGVQTMTLGTSAIPTVATTANVNLKSGSLLVRTLQPGTGDGMRTFNWSGGTLGNYATNEDMVVSIPTLTLASGGGQMFDIAGSTATANVSSQINGAGGFIKTGDGTLLLTGMNIYAGRTEIQKGTVQISSSSNLGITGSSLSFNGGKLQTTSSFSLDHVIDLQPDGGTIETISGTTLIYNGVLAGAGSLTKTGAGTLLLNGTNTFTGGTAIHGGVTQISTDGNLGATNGQLSISGGTLHTTADISTSRSTLLGLNNGTIETDSGTVLTHEGMINGPGALNKSGAGILNVEANNSYKGETTVSDGALYVNGDQSAATGTTIVYSGGTLGGTGTLGEDLNVQDGAHLAPGRSGGNPGQLTVNGNLVFGNTSLLNYDFGQANVVGGPLNDHIVVKGDLVLDGTINIQTTSGGAFDPGVYRIISYDGSFTDNLLEVGVVPASGYYVQTSVNGQVNLVNTSGLDLSYWDPGPQFNGQVNGGTGIWQTSATSPINTNWTEQTGMVNAPYQNGAFAVFMGTGGTVTVNNNAGEVTASGLQFAGDGYFVQGDAIKLVGSPTSVIRVGDGTDLGGNYTAVIKSVLTGDTQLIKSDLGTLILTGANLYTGGTVINGGAIQISANDNLGASGTSLLISGGTLRTTADLSIDRSTELESLGGIFDTIGDTRLDFSATISGTGNLTKIGLGTLSINEASTYTGTTLINSGVLVTGGENILSESSDFTVAQRATLALGDFNQTISSVSNAGTVDFGTEPGTVLNITGNYTGKGGLLSISTRLGADASSSDLLVVTGDASGTGSLKVVNAGGPGALTTADGIKVIEVGGASDAQFTLIGDYSHDGQQAVVGGAYAYKLYHNGVTDPVDGNWYLRSELKDKPVDPGDPTDPMDPDEPIDVPLYQAGASVYDTYPQILLGLNGVTTLQQRVGNRSWAGNGNRIIAQGADAIGSPYAAPEEAGTFTEGNGVWGRIEGAHNRIDPRSSTTSVAYDYNTYKLHAGLDGMLLENEAGRLIGGFSVHYARGSANTWSVYDADNGGGKIRTDGYGLGSSLTWYGDNGLYLDAQVQATWYDSDLDFNGGNSSLVDGNHGFGYALSLESGKRLALNETWSLTPQAQLTWSSVNFDRFTDTFGSSVSLDRADSLQGRLGLALNHQNAWYNASGNINRTNLYGIGNLYYEFLEGTKVSVDGTSLANQNQRLWGGIGLGGSYNWNNDKYSVYGEGSINASLANFADSYSYKATTGFKVRW
ncbi:autotransporter outer membrane beta-barrel domain-containing protein [Brucella anthropi]|uniref:autotransporter outer membrane beta-barrel domain-containing protein n=1 Tax=Brucella anthropi TaxID=529 RepID=UPI000CFA9285|nr:autotransporter outer membrane beta-barrel domain-containing protein [Ochrobactrum sp. MYb49]PQZ61783.1 autotransporter outer membrane beta-barrel domain-containing protein [Ochrobactrum sp. MYb49]